MPFLLDLLVVLYVYDEALWRVLCLLDCFEQRIMTALIDQGEDMGPVTPLELSDPQKDDDPQCPAHFRQSLMWEPHTSAALHNKSPERHSLHYTRVLNAIHYITQ